MTRFRLHLLLASLAVLPSSALAGGGEGPTPSFEHRHIPPGPLRSTLLPGAQKRKAPELSVNADSGTATLRIEGLLEEKGLRNALLSGLPIRIHIVTELWRDRFFDDLDGRAEWRATLILDPLAGEYVVQESTLPGAERAFATLQEARAALQERFRIPLRPREEGRYYYLATVEVETLSLSDLEELRRWLRGDLADAASGEREVESAIARGLRRLFVRMLKVPARRLQLRTRIFDFKPEAQEPVVKGELR